MTAKTLVSFFKDQFARSLATDTLTLAQLQTLILATTARRKAALPWLKLAQFGNKRSLNGSLRHDDNVNNISGLEADYDGEALSVQEGAAILKGAGLRGLIYTSPSHSDATPRWRLLLPTTQPRPPGDRSKLIWAVNELFGGIFAPESFVLSQAYYFGSINRNPQHRAIIVAGRCVDQVLADALLREEVAVAARPQAQLNAEFWRVARAVAFIPNNDLPWKYWADFGLAIFGAVGDEGGPIFAAWSRRSRKHDKDYTKRTWRGFGRSPPNRIGAGTVFYLANKFCRGWANRLDDGDPDAQRVVVEFLDTVDTA
jgi:primase-like protein